jgi:hypothetical protein
VNFLVHAQEIKYDVNKGPNHANLELGREDGSIFSIEKVLLPFVCLATMLDSG